jgi:hypothetical protein
VDYVYLSKKGICGSDSIVAYQKTSLSKCIMVYLGTCFLDVVVMFINVVM